MNPTTATETHTVENVQHHSSDFSNQLASRIVANQLSGMGQKTMLKVGESRIQDEVTDSQISEILRNAGRRSRNGDEKQPCKGKDGTCRRHKHVLVENYGDAGKRETIPLSPLVAETVMKVPAQNENSPHPEQSVGQLTQDAPLQNRSLHKTLPKLPDSQQRAAHGVRSEEHHEAGILSSESKVRRRDSGISVASTTSHPEERRQQMELEKRRRERNRQREAEKREIHTKNKKKAPLRLLSLGTLFQSLHLNTY